MSHRILPTLSFLAALAVAPGGAGAEPATVPSKQASAGLVQAIPSKPLEAMLREIAPPSGIRFRVAPGLERDPIPARPAGTGWPEVVGNLLRGYNYVGTWDAKGRLRAVSVTGRKGDGSAPIRAAAAPAAGGLLSYRGNSGAVPTRYRSYKPGSVYPVEIPVDRLRHMPKGTRVSIDLPDGRYELIHDNAWRHGNGDETWVGYVEGAADGPYRALLTLGDAGVEGQIRTPGGVYQLESDGTQGWLVDMNASGLQPATLEGDEHLPAGVLPGSRATAASAAKGRVTDQIDTTPTRNATLNSAGQVVIDVTILYTSGLANQRIRTRLNHLLALANQALADSRVHAVLRLAAARQTGYPNGGSNDAALDDLTFFARGFGNVPRMRLKTGADLVLLLRPFLLASQGGNCGEAWVNGSGGADLLPELAFGVVGYGSSRGYFCSPYTLAHEAGHTLGATHDRAHTDIPGVYDYSYGYGIPGLFGDIMSYIDPEIGLYANPEIRCAGRACGIAPDRPNAADVALTFNKTAATVSAFVNAVVP